MSPNAGTLPATAISNAATEFNCWSQAGWNALTEQPGSSLAPKKSIFCTDELRSQGLRQLTIAHASFWLVVLVKDEAPRITAGFPNIAVICCRQPSLSARTYTQCGPSRRRLRSNSRGQLELTCSRSFLGDSTRTQHQGNSVSDLRSACLTSRAADRLLPAAPPSIAVAFSRVRPTPHTILIQPVFQLQQCLKSY